MKMNRWPKFVIMKCLPLDNWRNILTTLRSMLRIEGKEKRHILQSSSNSRLCEGIKADIMISNAHNNWYQSIQFFVNRLKHPIKIIPAVVAVTHAVIINSVSSKNDDIWVEN